MKRTDSRKDAPLSRFLQPARAADRADALARYRRALLGQADRTTGILMPPTRTPERDRAYAALFGPQGQKWHLRGGI